MENTHQVEGRVPHLISCGESSTGAEQESSRAELEEGGEVRRATFLTRREAAGAQSSPGEMDPQRCPGTMWGAADNADSRLPPCTRCIRLSGVWIRRILTSPLVDLGVP